MSSSLARQLERKHTVEVDQRSRSVEQNVPLKQKITLFEKVLVFLTLIGVIMATYLVLSTYASSYIVNRDIHHLENTIKQQATVNEALNLQVTELSAPDRIVKIATEQLGMTLNDKNVKVVQN